MPPENSSSEVSATIVTEMAQEFDLNSYCQMETEVLQQLSESFTACPAEVVDSNSSVDATTDNLVGHSLIHYILCLRQNVGVKTT